MTEFFFFFFTLPVFPSRTNVELNNFSVTPKMVEKVIKNLDSSKASGPDCISVVVLKNCDPELSYIHTGRTFQYASERV